MMAQRQKRMAVGTLFRKWFGWDSPRSLKTLIVWLFIPVIIECVGLVGFLTYTVAARQIQVHAYTGIGDTVNQTRKYIDNRLTAIFEQLVALENDIDTLSLIKRLDEDRYGVIQPGDYIRVDRNLERIFSSYYSMLDSILIYFNEGRLMLSKKDYMTSRNTFQYQDWRLRYHGNRTEYYWRSLRENDIFLSFESKNRIASLFKMYGDAESHVRGVIMFNLKEDFFRGILEDARISEHGYLIIVSPDGIINFKEDIPNGYQIDGIIQKSLLTASNPTGQLSVRNSRGEKMKIIYDTISVNQWKLAAVFPEDDILNLAAFIKNITLAVMGIILFTAVLLSNLLAKIVTTPLAELTEKVRQVKAGNLDVPFEAQFPEEIGVLNDGISQLLARVRMLIEQVRLEQEQKRLAELDTLQAQIKPHFLYNTLDSIKQLCELGETREAGAMVAALAKFFRISISNGREVISIAEELEHIRNYLVIMKMRYADRFDYDIRVNPETYPCEIIKLTLQPLVENAIYHGIKEKRGLGQVIIDGYIRNDRVILEVRDNGAGMTAENLERVRQMQGKGQPGRSVGLANVARRLQLHYGPEYGLEIDSTPENGTCVRVQLPVRLMKEGKANDPGDDC
ncbi:MAG TPA: sensor histidine kinase [Bacillota bacterium]|nr:sensor histidine kinase [Bacillota bacterium]HPT87256.1 sensor histidine kinase [Bacillota bacterium]